MALAAGVTLADPSQWRREWPDTDFSRSVVDFDEIMSGGPPKDGIPAIDAPRFVPAQGETRLDPREPVQSYDHPDAPARAYPIRYLVWHEIVNDEVAGLPIAVTYCPLCNSGMVFDARIGGRPHTFGVTGKLRHSDMVMYDRQTESWWQQAIGEGIVGTYTGRRLTQLPARMESWEAFRDSHPDGLVMDEPDWRRGARRPFLYSGEDPPHDILPLARVVRVGERAWPLERVREEGEIREAGLVLRWREGQASALDAARIAAGREVGNVVVQNPAGEDIPHDIPFAFAFHAFYPNGEWMLGGS